jgi:uncharacterized membrane protein
LARDLWWSSKIIMTSWLRTMASTLPLYQPFGGIPRRQWTWKPRKKTND